MEPGRDQARRKTEENRSGMNKGQDRDLNTPPQLEGGDGEKIGSEDPDELNETGDRTTKGRRR